MRVWASFVKPRRRLRISLLIIAAAYIVPLVAARLAYRRFLYPAPQGELSVPDGTTLLELRASDGVAVHALELGASDRSGKARTIDELRQDLDTAYSLIPEGERASAHLRIGRLLSSQVPPDEIEERVFEIVNQLDRGAVLITARDERERVAELDLVAGMRAKRSTAYASALRYLADDAPSERSTSL